MTRHELKAQVQHDPFAESVNKAFDYVSSHRSIATKWAAVGIAVLLVILGFVWYRSYARSQRQQDLESAFEVLGAPVGPNAAKGVKSYPTDEAKHAASLKVLTDVLNKDGDSHEGLIARYYRGTLNAQQDPKAAENDLKVVADSSADVSSLAKIALADLYAGENRVGEAQALLRSLINKPNALVSKQQAQIMLAQLDETANPQEAKQILQDLKKPDQDPAIARAAEQVSAQLAH